MSQVSGRLITRNYNQFRGVDFSNRMDEVNIYRSPDAVNMWKNYKNSNGKCIETRPDIELLSEYSDTIFGLFFYDYNGATHRIVHSGTKLYDNDNVIYSNMAEHESKSFIYAGIFYIKDGTHYLTYNGTTCGEVVGYVPTTTISRSPAGGGTKLEDINLISPYRKNTFVGDGTSTVYYLDSQNTDHFEMPIVKVNGEEKSYNIDFSYDHEAGTVTFYTAPPAPDTVGQDNVEIQYCKYMPEYRDEILKCTLLEVFDNRIFFGGNPDYPNYIWHTSLDDPTYCSDLDYYQEGMDDSPVKALVAGNNALWVLKAPSQANTTIFYHNPTIDQDYGKIYPSSHSSISTGCRTTGINFRDTICFYSENGLEAITSDVTTEQAISHKSSLVDSKLLNESNFDNMILEEWEGYLLTIMDNKIYLANSKEYAQISDHYEYEWYYFEFNQSITSTRVKNGVLYLCTKETSGDTTSYKIYTLTNTDDNRNVESYWTTIEDEFGYPEYQKITNKKGCVVDADKDITVYARTDNKSFDLIKKFKNTKGYIVPRIKKKKWKSIQLKFYSKKPFRLYSSTLESYVGSYIKR